MDLRTLALKKVLPFNNRVQKLTTIASGSALERCSRACEIINSSGLDGEGGLDRPAKQIQTFLKVHCQTAEPPRNFAEPPGKFTEPLGIFVEL